MNKSTNIVCSSANKITETETEAIYLNTIIKYFILLEKKF